MTVYLSIISMLQNHQKHKCTKQTSSPLRVNVAVLTPMTWPFESINGPPELPETKMLTCHIRNIWVQKRKRCRLI